MFKNIICKGLKSLWVREPPPCSATSIGVRSPINYRSVPMLCLFEGGDASFVAFTSIASRHLSLMALLFEPGTWTRLFPG